MALFHTADPPPIRPLSPDVLCQLQGSGFITSLHDVVIGLLENSLDAASTRISLHADFSKSYCSVQDNGHGISAHDLGQHGCLAKKHCTSRSDAVISYGRDGYFLAALASVSRLTLKSRQGARDTASSLYVSHVTRVSRLGLPGHELDFSPAGTAVHVRDLFWNVPVRARQSSTDSGRAYRPHWRALVHAVAALLIAFAKPLSLTMQDDSSGDRIRIQNLQKASDPTQPILHVLTRCGFITADSWPSWTAVSRTDTHGSVSGAISLDPSTTKLVQFISYAHFPLHSSGRFHALYDSINTLFKGSHSSHVGPGAGRLTELRAVKMWPMFYLRLEPRGLSPPRSTPQFFDESFQRLENLTLGLVFEWLRKHHFVHPGSSLSLKKMARMQGDGRIDRFARLIQTPPDPRSLPQRASSAYGSGSRCSENFVHRLTKARGSCQRMLQRPATTGGLFTNPAIQGLYDGYSPTIRPSARDSEVAVPDALSPGRNVANENPQPALPHAEEPADGREDDLVPWKDPASGQHFLLNIRSGTMHRPNEETSVSAEHNIFRLPPRHEPSSLKSPAWVSNVIGKWNNPVFGHMETTIPAAAISMLGEESKHVHDTECCTASRNVRTARIQLNKAALADASVIAQVDAKFILVRLAVDNWRSVLALVDQHAADERVKLEDLFRQLTGTTNRSLASDADVCRHQRLDPPISFDIHSIEATLVRERVNLFARWGVLYRVVEREHERSEVTQNLRIQARMATIEVLGLPGVISERCIAEKGAVRDLIVSGCVERSTEDSGFPVASRSDSSRASGTWLDRLQGCPAGIVEMLNSRACRSAVMFNDILGHSDCVRLVADLARCALPFQCAHGRPTMVPLVDLAETMDYGGGGRSSGLPSDDTWIHAPSAC